MPMDENNCRLTMLLKKGNGHQAVNRQKAIDFLVATTDAEREQVSGHNNIIRQDDKGYWVSAYAESGPVMTRAPNAKNEDWTTEMASFCDGIKLVRQYGDGRIAVYTIDAMTWEDIVHQEATKGLSKVEWDVVNRVKESVTVTRYGE